MLVCPQMTLYGLTGQLKPIKKPSIVPRVVAFAVGSKKIRCDDVVILG